MPINPIFNDMSMAQLPGELGTTPAGAPGRALQTNPFEEVLSAAVDSLEGVSNTEFRANALINDYIRGNAELHEVMLATSKMNIMVQLAVTVVTTAVSSFKEMTQMQI